MSTKKITIGNFGKPFGILGWIHVYSYTSPPENIKKLHPWLIKKNDTWQVLEIEAVNAHGKGFIAKIQNCSTPELAKTYTGIEITVDREQLPKPKKNEYYWSDLEGCAVINTQGIELGQVAYLFATGANDVIAVKKESNTGKITKHLIPFIKTVILQIDLEKRSITVDWDEDF
jgi:16S rRNA processing protein RimM